MRSTGFKAGRLRVSSPSRRLAKARRRTSRSPFAAAGTCVGWPARHDGACGFPWTEHRGRIHLDPLEWWSAESFAVLGDPITQWLPHEIGHVLGLQHSRNLDHTMCHGSPTIFPTSVVTPACVTCMRRAPVIAFQSRPRPARMN